MTDYTLSHFTTAEHFAISYIAAIVVIAIFAISILIANKLTRRKYEYDKVMRGHHDNGEEAGEDER